MKIKVKKLSKEARLPKRANFGDAGADLYAVSKEVKGNKVIYGTGLAFDIPLGYVGIVSPRSSVYKRDLVMSNSIGVIDSGYRGEVKAIFTRKGKDYNLGERIAQLMVIPVELIDFEEGELSESERGEKGFGSSGKN